MGMLNPVRAGLVARVRDWRWGSTRASAGIEPGPGWLDADWLVAQFAHDRDAACAPYRRFVAEGRCDQKLSVAAPSLIKACIDPEPVITTPAMRSSSV